MLPSVNIVTDCTVGKGSGPGEGCLHLGPLLVSDGADPVRMTGWSCARGTRGN